MGSDSGKDSSKDDKSFSFFGNLAEDLGNIASGNVSSPHSAYDERNASAMAKKNGGKKEDYLPGGVFGPGSGSYSPSEFHEAGIAKQKDQDAKSTDKAQSKTAPATSRHAVGSLVNEDDPAGLLTPSLSPTIDDGVGPLGLNKTKDVAKVQSALVSEGVLDEESGYIGTKTVDATKAFQQQKGLKVDGQINPGGPTETALLGKRSAVASPYSRAPSTTPSIEQQVKTWADSQQRQTQAKTAPQSGNFSKNGVTFTDNWANELIGGKVTAPATAKTAPLGRTPDQKAADVGEQPMTSKASTAPSPSTPSAPQADAPKANKPHMRGRKNPVSTGQRPPTEVEKGLSTFAKAAVQSAGRSGVNMLAGITSTVGPMVGRTTNWGKYRNAMTRLDGLLSEEERQTPSAKLGNMFGGGVGFASELTGFGGFASAFGETFADAEKKGLSTTDLSRNLAYEAASNALAGKIGKTLDVGAMAVKNAGKATGLRDLLSKNTFDTMDNAITATTSSISYGAKRTMDWLAGEHDKDRPTKDDLK